MAWQPELLDARRRTLLAALAAGVAVPGEVLAQAIFGSRPQVLPAEQSIYRLSGSVTVEGQPATLQTRVRAGQTVETGPGSEAIFAVGSHALLLREQSKLAIEPPAQATGSVVIGALRILSGKLLAVSRNAPMRITTATATIGVRGTGWYVESDPERTYFCTCYGTSEVGSTDDPTSLEIVQAKQHDRPLYVLREGAAGERVRNAPFINHTDQELALIEALVGRTPPFVFPKDDYNAPRREY